MIRKGKLEYLGLPSLNNILLVDGLTANLIRISQICDQELCVKFNSTRSIITNKQHTQLMRGYKS